MHDRDRDDILKALEQVIDPELKLLSPSSTWCATSRRGRRARRRHDRADRRRLPAAQLLPGPGARHVGAVAGVTGVELRFDVMSPEEKAALSTRLRGGRAGARDLARPGHARRRRRVRQGRRRQVDAHREPRRVARRARRAGGRARRRRLRPLDPAHARRAPAADRRRPDDRPARTRRSEADVDRLLPGRQQPGDVARADAAQGARAVPLRRPLGRARHARRRHAARHRRRRHLARPAASARRGARRHDAPAARAAGGRPCGRDGAKRAMRLLGVVENMSRRRPSELRLGGGERLAAELGVPLLGQVPFDPALREAGDAGCRGARLLRTSEAVAAIDALAEARRATRRGTIRKALTVLASSSALDERRAPAGALRRTTRRVVLAALVHLHERPSPVTWAQVISTRSPTSTRFGFRSRSCRPARRRRRRA